MPGVHDPVIPLSDVSGRSGISAFSHQGPDSENCGIMKGLPSSATVMVSVAMHPSLSV